MNQVYSIEDALKAIETMVDEIRAERDEYGRQARVASDALEEIEGGCDNPASVAEQAIKEAGF